MRVDILTLFPNMFSGPFDESIIKRAGTRGIVDIKIHQLRDWGLGSHKTVDGRPYGGGTGMVLLAEPIYRALHDIKGKAGSVKGKVKTIFLDPAGEKFTQKKARELSKVDHLILIAGHYETIDERIKENLIDECISIGDYVLTGGEIPAMVLIDTIVRLLPGVLEKEDATAFESFEDGLLEYPQYSRPEEFNGWKVPEVLLSGDHKKIEAWKKEKSLEKTKKVRPDLLDK
ncbi:MAG: tRNA (guanosine(37)-N1)-methyltransferase TrmD [bacterium]|nr:tRNA (guanosine(37)-N1)-methyltransferase TrmD [bacterium]